MHFDENSNNYAYHYQKNWIRCKNFYLEMELLENIKKFSVNYELIIKGFTVRQQLLTIKWERNIYRIVYCNKFSVIVFYKNACSTVDISLTLYLLISLKYIFLNLSDNRKWHRYKIWGIMQCFSSLCSFIIYDSFFVHIQAREYRVQWSNKII